MTSAVVADNNSSPAVEAWAASVVAEQLVHCHSVEIALERPKAVGVVNE